MPASPARVAFDQTPATMGTTGVARYVRELWQHLLEERTVTLVPFAFGRGPHEVPAATQRRRIPYRAARQAWSLTGHPRVEALTGPVDLVHVTDLVPPPTRGRTVLTVHDLVAIERPDLHSPRQREAQHAQLEAARRADLVIVDAAVTGDLLRARGVVTPVVTVHLASFGAAPVARPVVGGRFLLAVGELAARKDLPTLVAGFRAAGLPSDVRLVLAGPDGFGAQRVRELVGDRVIALGRVTDAELAALYRDAVALCSASVAEGFNLPLVEAITAGLPVVASALPVTDEIGGGAVLTVPVGEPDAWAAALLRVVEDGALRADLARRGRVRAQHFSWGRTAAATAQAYARTLA